MLFKGTRFATAAIGNKLSLLLKSALPGSILHMAIKILKVEEDLACGSCRVVESWEGSVSSLCYLNIYLRVF